MRIFDMKSYLKVIIATVLLSTPAGCGGGSSGGSGGKNFGLDPVSTPVGVSSGFLVGDTIGFAGGTVSTPDGKITITFPAGALGVGTEIDILPITNTAPGGLGKGYRLTPDGQVFQLPVELTVTYTDDQLEGSTFGALGVAMQTAGGYWHWIEGAVVDDAAKTVTVTATHFTDFALVRGYRILPSEASVESGLTVALRVVFCFSPAPVEDPEGGDEPNILGFSCDSQDEQVDGKSLPVKRWSVNGVAGGKSGTGTVKGNGASATYTAPSSLPEENPVAVSADVTSIEGEKTTVVSTITITE